MRIKLSDRGDLVHDLELARQIGVELRQPGSQLDFTGVESVSVEFLRTVIETQPLAGDQTALLGLIDLATIKPEILAAFMQAMQPAFTSQSSPGGEASGSDLLEVAEEPVSPFEQPETGGLDPFAVLRQVQDDYRAYVQTFQQFLNPEIRDWVLKRIESGVLLWKDPYIQLARPFERGKRLEEMVDEKLLHPGVLRIFRQEINDPNSIPIHCAGYLGRPY